MFQQIEHQYENGMNLSMGTRGKVKDLKWKAFKPHKTQIFSPVNKLARKSTCEHTKVVRLACYFKSLFQSLFAAQ